MEKKTTHHLFYINVPNLYRILSVPSRFFWQKCFWLHIVWENIMTHFTKNEPLKKTESSAVYLFFSRFFWNCQKCYFIPVKRISYYYRNVLWEQLSFKKLLMIFTQKAQKYSKFSIFAICQSTKFILVSLCANHAI